MPALQTVLAHLNNSFGKDRVTELAQRREEFGPGKKLSDALNLVLQQERALLKAFIPYVDSLPASFQEALKSLILSALSSDPPIQITFAWAPGYDFELSVWHAPDTRTSKGGITILLKSRYPTDEHPIQRKPEKKAKSA